MHTVLMVIHVLSVIVWFGVGLGSAYIGSRLVAEGGTVAVAWMRISERMGPRFYGSASGLTLLSGIGLVLVDDAYSFGSRFVVFGLTVWILIAIGNIVYGVRREKKASAAFEAGDETTGRRVFGELSRFLIVEFALLTAVVIAMVSRWGP